MAAPPDPERRFGGISRLYGDAALSRLRAARITIVGIGGVGSWAVEALARSGVGRLTLIDLDMVAESNLNRQIHALEDTLGQAKVDAMRTRITAINPECRVDTIEDFITPDNLDALLPADSDVLIDAIDQVRAKVAMLVWATRRRMPVLTAGAAGGQIDPTRICCDDLARTEQDPLLAKVRAQLRRQHGFARGPKARFGIPAVYSSEPLRYPQSGASCSQEGGPTGLNCAGFGSSVCVTAPFGFALAARAIDLILRTKK